MSKIFKPLIELADAMDKLGHFAIAAKIDKAIGLLVKASPEGDGGGMTVPDTAIPVTPNKPQTAQNFTQYLQSWMTSPAGKRAKLDADAAAKTSTRPPDQQPFTEAELIQMANSLGKMVMDEVQKKHNNKSIYGDEYARKTVKTVQDLLAKGTSKGKAQPGAGLMRLQGLHAFIQNIAAKGNFEAATPSPAAHVTPEGQKPSPVPAMHPRGY